MFYFDHLLQQGLAGIDHMAILPAMISVAYAILLISFLIGMYQAAMRGGDVQALGIAAIKYLAVALILANWSAAFGEVNRSFNQVAQFIDSSSGAGDMFMSWLTQLQQQFQANGSATFLGLISGSDAALITVLLILVAYLVYAIAIIIFGFFYVLYGCVLYALGPIVLALLPVLGIGQLAKNYATNVMVWNAWSILYALFGALITAINANRLADLNNFFGFFIFTPEADSVLLGLISIFYALAVLLIPFIAKRVISGDVGSTAYSLVRAGAVAAGTAIAGMAGFAAAAGAGTTVGAGASASGAGMGTSSTASSTATMSSFMPPPQPNLASTMRSGLASMMSGDTAPAAPSAQTNSSSSSPANREPSNAAGSRAPNSNGRIHSFRPAGLAQTFAFHAGRVAGEITRPGANSSQQDAERYPA